MAATKPIDLSLVRQEWPPQPDDSVYFNTGSCGRKPRRVLKAIEDGWRWLNENPTVATFLDPAPMDAARTALAEAIGGVEASDILLVQNSTQALHLVLNSFLLGPGDEVVTTTHEHGSVNTILRWLAETRGVVVRKVPVEPLNGESVFVEQVKALLNGRTRLVQCSEIDCYTGWRPDLIPLAELLKERGIPFLIDGAHSLGQGPCAGSNFELYAGSCHKWLGAPNGTGFLYCSKRFAERLKPLWISDHFYNQNESALSKFEFQGTADVVKWLGVRAACELEKEITQQAIANRQRELVTFLAERLRGLAGAQIRTPLAPGETSGLLCVTWEPDRVPVSHIRDHIWEKYKIWTQPDFCYGLPGHGLRLSCHVSIETGDIDRLIDALREIFSVG